jgi:hypothetical protein
MHRPPLLVGHSGAAFGVGGLDGAPRGTLDVAGDKDHHRVHLDVGQADAVDGGELALIHGQRVGAEHRAVGRDVQHPRMPVVHRPVVPGDSLQPGPPP